MIVSFSNVGQKPLMALYSATWTRDAEIQPSFNIFCVGRKFVAIMLFSIALFLVSMIQDSGDFGGQQPISTCQMRLIRAWPAVSHKLKFPTVHQPTPLAGSLPSPHRGFHNLLGIEGYHM